MAMRIRILLLAAGVAALPLTCLGAGCGISATSIHFGGYSIFDATPRDSSGTVTVQCQGAQPSRPVNVTISISTGISGAYATRQMASLTVPDRLRYNLFIDAARTIVWGNGTGGSSTLSRSVDRTSPWTASIYARVPQRQNVSVGSYSDNITLSIDF
jgi:spore coat protein U-like protein